MTWAISSSTDVLDFWEIKRVASSAYIRIGPMLEPCMTDRFIGTRQHGGEMETELGGLIIRSIRNDMIHCIIKTGVARQNSLRTSITWSTVSKALPTFVNPALVTVAKIHWRRSLLDRKRSPAHFLCPMGKHCYLPYHFAVFKLIFLPFLVETCRQWMQISLCHS